MARPSNYSTNIHPQRFPVNLPSESEEEPESSESDSDSDSKFKKSKKPKIKLKPRARYSKPAKKNYDIWSTKVQEDVLAETLNSCDVTAKDRSRDVESYDFSLGTKYYQNEERDYIRNQFQDQEPKKGNKRTRDNRKNANFRQQQRKRSSSRESIKGSPREILDLVADENCSEEDLAKDIANKLYEEKQELICKFFSHLYHY